MTLPILYSFRRCPYAMRARLAIAASGQRCQLREVILRDKPPALLQASPKGTVPVLVMGEEAGAHVIEQSLDIMLWALGRQDPLGWLQPQDGDLSSMCALIDQCDSLFKRNLDRYKYPQQHADATVPSIDAYALAHRDKGGAWLAGLEAQLHRGFLFGARASLADMAILPFVRQYAHVDQTWFAAQPWPHLHTWLQDWMHSAHFAAIMPKFAPWREGDQPVWFPMA